MANTQDSSTVRLSNVFILFFESKKKTRGNVRNQAEAALRGNKKFISEITAFCKKEGIDF